jgi:iron complex outermembrane recepter protein
MQNIWRTLAVSAFAAFFAAGSLTFADVQARSLSYDLNIPSEDLTAALQSFAIATHHKLLYKAELTAGKTSRAIKGHYSAHEAIEALLSGTGLTFEITGASVVLIKDQNESKTGDLRSDTGLPASSAGEGTSVRLAQANPNPTSTSGSTAADQIGPNRDSSESHSKEGQIQEIVVTGTRIPGATPASPVIVIDRAAIDQSGYATIGDVIRSLPESFGGGQNPGVNGTGQANAAYNYGSASSANLRGLGSDATLTLVNGHRLAFNGINDSVDISAIPLAAVERIEILTDGASAIYGSDAVAGVVNVILKPDYNGAETTLRYGDSTGGGGGDRQFDQTFGFSGERGGFVLTYEHFDQNRLLASQRDFSSLAYNPTSLLPADTRNTGLFSGHFNLNDFVSVFADALFTHREPVALTGFGPTFYVDTTPVNQYGLAGGLRFALPANWSASVTASSARDAQADTETTNGGMPVTSSFENKTMSGEVQAAGPLASLWSGPLAVAFAAGYRREEMNVNFDGLAAASRDIKYGAVELNIPLIAQDASRPALHRLEFSAATRYEQYSDFGDATNPKLGLIYVPLADLTLKGTWGRSFHAPGLWQKYGGPGTLAEDAADFGEDEPGKVGLEGIGSNPNLGAETAHSWTTSFVYTPAWLTGAKATVSTYGIDYRNRITIPISSAVGIVGSPVYAPFIVTNPSASLISSVTNPPYVLYNYSSAQTFSPSNVYAYYQAYYQNVTRQTVSGVDILLDYRFNTEIGVFDPGLNVTHINLDQYSTPTAPRTTLSGTIFNVPRYKARASLTWTQGPWEESTFVNYTSSEINNTGNFIYGSTILGGHVASWTTVDAQLTYTLGGKNSILSNFRIALSAQNLFDRAPPSVPYTSTGGEYAGLGFDPANASALGRFLSITATKKF